MKLKFIISFFVFIQFLLGPFCFSQKLDITQNLFLDKVESVHILSEQYSDNLANSFSDKLLLDRPFYTISIDSFKTIISTHFEMTPTDDVKGIFTHSSDYAYIKYDGGKIFRFKIDHNRLYDISNNQHYKWKKGSGYKSRLMNWIDKAKEPIDIIFERRINGNGFVKITNNKIEGTEGYNFINIVHDLPSDTFIVMKSKDGFEARILEHPSKTFQFQIELEDSTIIYDHGTHPSDDTPILFYDKKLRIVNSGKAIIIIDIMFKNGYEYSHEKKYYIDGKLNGERIVVNSDGDTTLHENYVGGYKNGIATYYNENGALKEEINWKVGISDSVQYYDTNTLEIKWKYIKESYKDE